MAKLMIVSPPEPQLTLELSLDEAAVLYLLLGHTAGTAKETIELYDVLGDEFIVTERADAKFAFTKGSTGLSHRIDPIKD